MRDERTPKDVCGEAIINTASSSTQNAALIKRFLRFHIVMKPLIKYKHNKFFIMLKRNSFNVHCKSGACQE